MHCSEHCSFIAVRLPSGLTSISNLLPPLNLTLILMVGPAGAAAAVAGASAAKGAASAAGASAVAAYKQDAETVC